MGLLGVGFRSGTNLVNTAGCVAVRCSSVCAANAGPSKSCFYSSWHYGLPGAHACIPQAAGASPSSACAPGGCGQDRAASGGREPQLGVTAGSGFGLQ